MVAFRLFFVFLCALALYGCATMSPGECKNANWRDVGLRDGMAGEPLSQLDRRTKDCAEAGVMLNTPQYLEGRNSGLRQYCRLDNAARVGLAGQTYRGVCAAGIEPEFLHRYNVGREVYRARGELRGMEQRRRSLEDRLSEVRGDDERRRVREELYDLDISMRRARDRLRDAERALDRLR